MDAMILILKYLWFGARILVFGVIGFSVLLLVCFGLARAIAAGVLDAKKRYQLKQKGDEK